MSTYALCLLRGGQYRLGQETRPRFRGAGTIIGDVDGRTALYLVCNGLAEIHEGQLPLKTEFLDTQRQNAQRNKQRKAESDFIIRCVLAEQQNNPTQE